MPVRKLTEKEELLESDRICSIAFAGSWSREEAIKALEAPSSPPPVSFGYFNQEGALTASMVLPEYQARYQGEAVPMIGVGGVASLPEHRYEGAVRQIFQTVLPWMRQRGGGFSALYPFSHVYYRRFGYELCQIASYHKIPTQALNAFRCTCQVSMVQPGQDLDSLQAVYSARLGQYNLAVQREDRHWEKLIGKDPCKERRYAYLLKDSSGPLAYVVFQAQEATPHSKSGAIRELAFQGPEGLRQLLGFLYRLAAQYDWFTVSLPEDTPLAALIPEYYDLEVSSGEQPMARILHVEKALARKAPQGVHYTVKVRDNLLPENNGVFRVSGGSPAPVEKLPDTAPADLSVDIGTLTQLCLGFLSLEGALYKPEALLSGNRAALEQAFPREAVFLTEFF